MKCLCCNNTKGKRRCLRYHDGLICSLCCGKNRNYKICNTECDFFPSETYELIHTNGIKLTEGGRGKVTLFSESLYLPNISDCLCMIIEKIRINIKNPVLISINMEFEIIEKIANRKVTENEIYLKDSWKRLDKLLPFLQIYTSGTGDIFNEKLLADYGEERVFIENNHADTWLPYSFTELEKISSDDRKRLNLFYDSPNTLYPI